MKELDNNLDNLKQTKKISLGFKMGALQQLILQRFQLLSTISVISFAVFGIFVSIKGDLIQNQTLAFLSFLILILVAIIGIGRHLYLVRSDIKNISQKIEKFSSKDWSSNFKKKKFKADYWPETLFGCWLLGVLFFGLSLVINSPIQSLNLFTILSNSNIRSLKIIILIFQIISAVILTLIMNAFGRKSRGLGYVNMSDILGEGNLGFNLIFRIFSPAIFISFISIILHKLQAIAFIHNIWLIVLWYIVLNFILLLSLNSWSFVNKPLYLSIQASALVIAYWFYDVALNRGLEFILPEGDNFRTEIWFIIIFYSYNLLNNYHPNYSKFHQSRSRVLKKRFEYFKQKYSYLLFDEFLEENLLNKIFFSIMIFEDINRPKFIRIMEKILFPFGFINSTGIMQIQNKKELTDEESIELAQKKILKIYNENKNKQNIKYQLIEYQLIKIICLDYNNNIKYFEEIISIYREIKFYRETEIKNTKENQNIKPSLEVPETDTPSKLEINLEIEKVLKEIAKIVEKLEK